jgi:hypothetical protein
MCKRSIKEYVRDVKNLPYVREYVIWERTLGKEESHQR